MKTDGFEIPDLINCPLEDGEVYLTDCLDGPRGSSKCQIMAAVNRGLRNEIIEYLKQYKNPFDKIDALTQLLSDNNHKYDYSVGFSEGLRRKKYNIDIGPLKFITPAFTLREGFYDPDGGFDLNGKKKLESPTYHLLGIGQCVTTANEVCRCLRPNGLTCEMVSAPSYCLNNNKRELQKVKHVYNHGFLPNGKKVTIDICANIMERDADSKGIEIDKNLLYKKDEPERPFVL